jgi:putative membrane-bound dehydrogenase-like protein
LSIPFGIHFLFYLLVTGCSENSIRTIHVEGLKVPEGFIIEEAVPQDLLSFPMFASFDDRGRLFVFESTGPNTMGTEAMLERPSYHIRLLEDVDGDGVFDKSNIFADSIPLPMGGSFFQGSLYISAPPNLERLTDTDGDGTADEREIILRGWTLNSNAATLSGPFIGPDGWLYLADARRGFEIKRKEGDILKGSGARIWRCLPDGSRLESYSGGGFDNSIEMIFTPSGETIGTMTYFMDPQDGQRDALMHWVEGGVYPKPHQVIGEDQLKLTGDLMPVMTKLARVAPSGLMRYRGPVFGKGFEENLFSAEFNTGRVMRHIVEEAGATFTTDDEPFMTSLSSDSHPTDILQDADGSLLVVITGGWFIEGCPLSRVAKPDVPGGIYRIRKTDAPLVEDPRGQSLDFENMTPISMVSYLSDPRFAVRDKAMETLVSRGFSATEALEMALQADDETVRTAVVFALYRIKSLNGVRSALRDESPMVRTAAVRVLGLARDRLSVDQLIDIVQNDQASVRRQAATAIGQIGDPRSIDALLNASLGATDRFVEHTIIHALTLLGIPEPLFKALEHPSAKIKRAAVIALDQMDGKPLTQHHLARFLGSEEEEMRHTGIWLASHHPEWNEVVVDFITKSLRDQKISDKDMAAVQDLMVTFSGDKRLEQFIATQLASTTQISKKLLLMEVVRRSPLEDLPDAWVDQLGILLKGGDSEVRMGVLNLIETRNIPSMENELDNLINNPNTQADLRLKALGARLISDPALSDTEFNVIVGYLDPEFDSPLRHLAVRVLARAELQDSQLLKLAQNQISTADLFLLPSLIDAFQGNTNQEVGETLLMALNNSTDRLDNLSEKDLQSLFSTFPSEVQSSAEPLMAQLHEQHKDRLSKLQELEDQLPKGDVAEGRKIFFGKSACSTCHSVGPEGGKFGPDLTNIGEIRARHDILEAIIYPNASFAREYETYKVETKTSTYIGIISEQISDAIVVSIGPTPGIRIPRIDIINIEPHPVSMMPPGLDHQLNLEEMAHLIAFLESLPYDLERLIEAREKE